MKNQDPLMNNSGLSGENYRDLVESSGSIIMKVDSDLNITYMNNFGLHFFGYSMEEILGRNVVGTTIPQRDDSGRDLEAMAVDIMNNPQSYGTNIHQNMRKNGELVWISWTNKPKYDRKGRLKEIFATGNDISKLIKAENALQGSRLESEMMIRYAPTGIYELDFTGPRMLSVNDTMCKITGYTRQELLSMNPSLLLDERSALVFQDRVRKILAGQEVKENVEYKIRVKDGRELWADLNVKIISAKGQSPRALVIAHDTTERRKVEEALRESEKRYRHLVRYAPTGIFSIDIDACRITEVNDVICDILGYEQDELLSINILDLLYEEGKVLFAERTSSALKGDPPEGAAEYRVRKKDGDFIWALVVATYHIENGKPPIATIIAHDITERKKTEKALSQSEERFRMLNETSPIGVGVSSQKGILLYANPSFERILGYDHGEMTGKKLSDIWWTPRERISFMEMMKDKIPVHDLEAQLRKKDGTALWTSVNGSMIIYEGKEAVMGTIQDISRRKRLENELKEYNETLEERVSMRSREILAERKRLLDVLETLPQMICLLKNDYHVVFSNRAFRKMFGESEGRRCYEYCFNKNEPCEFCETFNVFKSGKPHHWELKLSDGTVISANDFPFTDVDGSPLVLEMDFDITKQKHASHYTRSLIEASLDPLMMINPDGKITDLNGATVKATGFSREKLIGTDFPDYFTDPAKARSGYQLAFSRGMIKDYPLTIRHRNGKLTDVLYNASVYSDVYGKITGVFAAARDITVLKHAEKELKRSRQQMEELNRELLRSNRELENFAHVTSHDLQEPLRMITSFTQLLALKYDGKYDDDAKEYMGYIVEGGKRMYELINGLLAYSRLSRLENVFSKIDLNRILDIVRANLAIKIKERNCTIECEPLPVVYANHNQMIQLFQNLISNSIKFSKDPPHIYVSSSTEKKQHIFCVRDEGIGIEPQYFEKIFLIFQRLMPRNEYEGTGIGLSICKKIVENHKGKIWVESEPGKGSVFCFTLPKQKVKT